MNAPETFSAHVSAYANTAEINDAVFRHFTSLTWANPSLSSDRRHIEDHQLGFGDPAFHHMWLLLLREAAGQFPKVRCLEIGVFKGQIISLWTMLARDLGIPLELTAVTPLQGPPLTASRLGHAIRHCFDRKFREQTRNGNFYPDEDYELAIRNLFAAFNLDFGGVRLLRGFSTATTILHELRDARFEIVYVDGDHTLEGVRSDIENYAPKVTPGGWIVMNDASFFLPGTAFWKGHEAVSLACSRLDELGFINVLNVGHNRIFQRRD